MVFGDATIHIEDKLFNVVEYPEFPGEYSLLVKSLNLHCHLRDGHIKLDFLTMKELLIVIYRIKHNDYELGLEAEIFISKNSTKRG